MASTKLFLDCRRAKPGMPSILKIAIGQGDQTAYISLSVKLLPSQWDGSRVVKHNAHNLLNAYLGNVRQTVSTAVYELTHQHLICKMSAKEIRDYVDSKLNPEKYETEVDQKLFLVRFRKCADSKKDSTKSTYYHTLNRIKAFIGDAALEKLRFEDINKDWLVNFNNFMALTAPSQNSRNIHFRNLRAVFNDAIDNDITTNYPFRNFKLKNVETEKRSLTVEQLRVLFFYQGEQHAEKYVDMFKLSFYLRGVNMKDIANLTTITNGRLNFNRSKTGHLYSMLVEPEAQQIIDKNKGTEHLVFIRDHWQDEGYFRRKMNKELQKFGPVTKAPGRGGKKVYHPLFPELTTYWARHTWATIAAELDIPNEVIAEGLGHEYGNRITNIYIRFDMKKVDKANRKIMDWVLYGKINGEEVVKPGTPEFFGMSKSEASKLGLL